MRLVRPLWPLGLLIGVAASVYASGLYRALSWDNLAANQAQWQAWVGAHPVIGGIAYVALYAAAVGLSLPAGGVLTVAGGWLFGRIAGTLLAVTGASSGAILLFLLARTTLGAALAGRARPFVERLRPTLERDGFPALLALRLIPVVPFWLSNLAPALLGMRLAPYALATVLGIIPATAVLASLGAGLGDAFARGGRPDVSILVSAPVLVPLTALALLALLPVAWRRWRGRHA